jgi:hypothetical protein
LHRNGRRLFRRAPTQWVPIEGMPGTSFSGKPITYLGKGIKGTIETKYCELYSRGSSQSSRQLYSHSSKCHENCSKFEKSVDWTLNEQRNSFYHRFTTSMFLDFRFSASLKRTITTMHMTTK